MTEIERIQQRIGVVTVEQRSHELQWQRADGALQVLRSMLAEVQREEEAAKVIPEKAPLPEVAANGEQT